MLRDIFDKSKEVAGKLTNVIMNYSEVEARVREATSDEAWGPLTPVMLQIADYTYSHTTYREVMDVLCKRLHPVNNSNWRRVYKSLILLDFLLKNGSELVVGGARDRIYDLRTLESFQYHDEYGKDHGENVRIKVQDVIRLLQDPDYLKQERAKTKANRHLYTGFSGGGGGSRGGGYYSSNWDDSYRSRYSDDNSSSRDCDSSWKPPPPVKTTNFSMDDSSKLTPNPRLGNFDEWNMGRERGFVDDVMEQVKEAWDMAKLSTRTIFQKTVHNPEPYESNPRMVSEEMYQFPESAVEVDGVVETERSNELPSPVSRSAVTRPDRQSPHLTSVQGQSLQQVSSIVAPSIPHQPRPPSVELICSWDDNLIQPTPRVNNPVDMNLDFSSSNADSTTFWPGTNSHHIDGSNWSSSALSSNGLVENLTVKTGASELGDFGDFVSAGLSNPTPHVSVSSGQQDFQQLKYSNDLFANLSNNLVPTQAWPSTTAESFFAGNQISSPSAVATSNHNTPIDPPKETRVDLLTSATSRQPVGGLWKDIDTLGINLDTIANPQKMGVRNTGPTLLQLKEKQQQQPKPCLNHQ